MPKITIEVSEDMYRELQGAMCYTRRQEVGYEIVSLIRQNLITTKRDCSLREQGGECQSYDKWTPRKDET